MKIELAKTEGIEIGKGATERAKIERVDMGKVEVKKLQ